MKRSWTPDDERTLIQLLKRLPQPWSYEMMHALNRVIPMIGVESVILRKSGDSLEVLLTQRDATDLDWPGYWHVPGSTLRDTDVETNLESEENFENPLFRVWTKELKLSFKQTQRLSAKKCDIILWRHARGACVSTIFCCRGDGIEFPVGQFFPVDDLPEPFLGGQKVVIMAAVRFYLANRKRGRRWLSQLLSVFT